MASKRLSLRAKMYLSLIAIAVVLLVSSIISVMEYRSMSSYVSDMIADNIRSINAAQKLSDAANAYNLDILAVIGDESSMAVPYFDRAAFSRRCDSLRVGAASTAIQHLADSVQYSFAAYMLTSLELQDVLQSDFIDTRTWYFERLQPRYNRLRGDIDSLSDSIYDKLADNSTTFESAFYRSIIPGMVAVAVGLLLILMLLFFLNVYYVNPLYRILHSLKNYRSYGREYSYDFEGDDQMSELNASVREITMENTLLRKRISVLKKDREKENL